MLAASKTIYDLGRLDNIPLGEGRTYQIEEISIAIFRTRDNAIYATQAHCPHKGGPLADGILGADRVICPLHAYKFQLSNGEALGNGCDALKTYSVSLNASGHILLTL